MEIWSASTRYGAVGAAARRPTARTRAGERGQGRGECQGFSSHARHSDKWQALGLCACINEFAGRMCAASNKTHLPRAPHHAWRGESRVRQFSVRRAAASQKRTVAPWFTRGLGLDFAAVAPHDALHRRQPEAVPREFILPMQARERLEEPCWRAPCRSRRRCRSRTTRCGRRATSHGSGSRPVRVRTGVFPCVAEQVAQHRHHEAHVAPASAGRAPRAHSTSRSRSAWRNS